MLFRVEHNHTILLTLVNNQLPYFQPLHSIMKSIIKLQCAVFAYLVTAAHAVSNQVFFYLFMKFLQFIS